MLDLLICSYLCWEFFLQIHTWLTFSLSYIFVIRVCVWGWLRQTHIRACLDVRGHSESCLSFHHVDPGYWTQIFRPGWWQVPLTADSSCQCFFFFLWVFSQVLPSDWGYSDHLFYSFNLTSIPTPASIVWEIVAWIGLELAILLSQPLECFIDVQHYAPRSFFPFLTVVFCFVLFLLTFTRAYILQMLLFKYVAFLL